MTLDADLALAALRMALADRRPAPGSCITLYACGEYRKLLAAHGIVASMSNQGDCWDNAVAESFFATLETELILEADGPRGTPRARRSSRTSRRGTTGSGGTRVSATAARCSTSATCSRAVRITQNVLRICPTTHDRARARRMTPPEIAGATFHELGNQLKPGVHQTG